MPFNFSYTMIVLLVNTLILTILALYTYKRRSINGSQYLILLLAGVALWSFCAFLEEIAGSLSMKIFLSKISYAGVTSAAPLLFLFILSYCGLGKKIKPGYQALIWLIPVATLTGAFTNELHGLVWTSVTLDHDTVAGQRAVYSHGPLVWIMALYSYLLLIAGIATIFRTAGTTNRLFRGQLITLTTAALAPWAGNIFYLAGLTPPGLDPTPVSFAITGIVITIGITRYQLLNITPIAYNALFKSMSSGVLVLDKSQRLVSFNPALKEMLNLTGNDVGKQISQIPVLKPEIAEHLVQNCNRHSELNLIKGGSKKWLDIKASKVTNSYNEQIGCLYSFYDITAQKSAEEALRQSEELNRRLLATIPDFVIRTDLDGNITYVNEHPMKNYPFIKKENIIGRNLLSFIAGKDRQRATEDFGLMFEIPLGINEYTLQIDETHTLECESNGQIIRDPEGSPAGMVFVVRDISKRKRTEEQLNIQYQQLHELNTTKDKFFSIIAHDLKSPFNSILGFSEILYEQIKEKDYEGIQEYAGIIRKSSQQAVNLLDNLLDWARSQTGRMSYNPSHLKLNDIVEETILIFNDVALQKAIEIKKEVPDTIDIFADRPMINTVLRNLISNAIKFTPEGGKIGISANLTKKNIKVTVSDNGLGIAPDRINKLFSIDQSTSTPGTGGDTGTGLGLVLCKEFVEKHGGNIWVNSIQNRGSRFSFALPLNQTTQS